MIMLKKKISNYLLISILSMATLGLIACASSGEEKKPAEAQAKPKVESYPLLPQEKYDTLWNQVENIDFVFESLPISLNLGDPPSVQTGLRQFTNMAPTIDPSCQRMGTAYYVGNGEQIMSADFYFTDSCTYFIFIEHGKKRYSAQMSPVGINFFNRALKKAGLSP